MMNDKLKNSRLMYQKLNGLCSLINRFLKILHHKIDPIPFKQTLNSEKNIVDEQNSSDQCIGRKHVWEHDV